MSESLNIPVSKHPRVVIIGGGFGGLAVARAFHKKDVQVILLDKHNYHTFQPLLYQVATAGLEPDSIAFPLRKIFKHYPNLTFRMAEVLDINYQSNSLTTSIGSLSYDFLVIASGSKTNFFGNSSFEKFAMPMKSVPEALNLRSLLLQNFESALLSENISELESKMNVVVVGGGPTGVETAGALAELKRHILPHDYPELDFRKMKIHLIEAAPRLLGVMSANASEKAEKFLTDLGVELWLNTAVKEYDGLNLTTATGKSITAKTVIWSAGVSGNLIGGLDPSGIFNRSRFLVNGFCQLNGVKNIFAIGDVAAMISENNPKGHPMIAPVAIQQGKLVADNILNQIINQPMNSFEYNDKGSMATVGRNKAVVDIGKIKFSGWFAWLTWMGLHLMMLVGFRNKLVVFVNWFWNYISYDRGIRLIIRPFKQKE